MNNQVTVFGANGKVGSMVVDELLKRGYSVVAFVHQSHQLPANGNLKIVQGDIYNAKDVDRALVGSVAIISALGSWGTPKKDILTVGMTHIIPSMRQHGISRIVTLTGADARAPGDSVSIIHRLSHIGIGVVAGKILSDGERHINLLSRSELSWTVVRSPIMSSTPPANPSYALSMRRPLPWRTIPRKLVALSMVDVITDARWEQKAPYVA